jgi:hypothetical protein
VREDLEQLKRRIPLLQNSRRRQLNPNGPRGNRARSAFESASSTDAQTRGAG